MNKLYLIFLLCGFTFFAQAQDVKPSQSPFPLEIVGTKMLKFYPNPANGVINFEFLKPVQKDLTLQVFNFIGKKVFEMNGVSQKTTVPLNDFYRGVYIFQLRDKTGRIVESGKFQVVDNK
ncbi:MAG TPA: T9SS type A sorting domain-containing protein [Segetibacter sp.]|nr:T9SS type A sorting domain-containing protein [Segetibacter sp.]